MNQLKVYVTEQVSGLDVPRKSLRRFGVRGPLDQVRGLALDTGGHVSVHNAVIWSDRETNNLDLQTQGEAGIRLHI